LSAAFAEPGPEEGMEPLRALAIQALARQAFDARALARFARPLDSALEQLARQALAAGNLDTARAAARRLADEPDPRWRAEGLALAGEAAFRAGDLQGTGAAFAHIFDPAQKLAGGRDPAALELAQALVVAQADRRDAGGARALADQLDALRSRVHLKAVAQLDALRVAVRE